MLPLCMVEIDWIRYYSDPISVDTVSNQFSVCIATRGDHMLDIFVEKIIVFPTDFSENLIVREPEDFEISFIGDIGMECSNTGYLEKFSKKNRLPPEDELRMEVDNIWLECEYLSEYPWCEGKGKLELRIEERWESTDREDLDSWTRELLYSGILRNDDTDLMPTLDQFA